MVERVGAVRDETLIARIVSRRPLRYTKGPSAEEDRPAHVRAGSGLVQFGSRLAVIQDDADFIALLNEATGSVDAVALPRRPGGARVFDDERGNKAAKHDFESCVVASIDGVDTLVAFGSGSTCSRESLLVLSASSKGEFRARVVSASDLYGALRARTEFSGSELNIEGAVLFDDVIRFFQRGNGAPKNGRLPVNATCDVAWARILDIVEGRLATTPAIERILEFDLGRVSDCPLTFTDAARLDASRVLYLAAAEGSPDAVRDGPVEGTAVGVIQFGAERTNARYALLLDERGAPATDKAEGIAVHESANRVSVVLDMDDPHRPSELCTVELVGTWR